MKSSILLLLLVSCNGPIANCDSPGLDCCTRDSQCEDTYGALFPLCHNPSPTTGVCAECVSAEDCDVYETCLMDDTLGGFCYEP